MSISSHELCGKFYVKSWKLLFISQSIGSLSTGLLSLYDSAAVENFYFLPGPMLN